MSLLHHIQEPLLLPLQFLRAIYRILTTRRLLALCFIPWMIGCAFFALCTWLFMVQSDHVVLWVAGDPESVLAHSLWWAYLVASVFVAAMVSVIAMSAFGAYFIQLFLEILLREKGLPVPEYASWSAMLVSIGRATRQELLRLLVLGILGIVFILAWFVIFLEPIVLVLGILITGYNIFDMPLAVMEVPFVARLSLLRKHWLTVLALGAIFTPILFVPFAGVLFAPAVYYVAVERLAAWKAQSALPAK